MPPNDFQLVFQLPEDCPLEDFGFEDDIALALDNPQDDKTKPHLVDGHSSGAGTIEFFVYTTNPHEAFELCKPLLESAGLLGMVVVRYRPVSGNDFTVIWPAG